MLQLFIITLLSAACTAEHYQFPLNVSRSTVSGIAAYRSALTLDWLAGEDSRQRELALAFETESTAARPRTRVNDCSSYSRPAAGKVARLMLELLRNLEGDEGVVIPELIKALVLAKLLVETSVLESEPDFEALVQTPGAMMGEPHATFPRIMALSWLLTTDPVTTKRNGWCPVTQLTQYLRLARPSEIAKQMRGLDPIIARARFIMEDFIQNVTPLMYPETTVSTKVKRRKSDSERRANAQFDVFPMASEKPSPSPPPAELFLNHQSPIDHPMDRFDNSAGQTHGLPWTIPWLLPLSVLVMLFNFVCG